MNGARAIPGYFAKAVRSKVARFMLQHPEQKGALVMHYDAATKDVVMAPTPSAGLVAANDVNPRADLARAVSPK